MLYSILCHFSGFNAYITLTCIIVPFIDVFSHEWYEREIERDGETERERERERKWRDQEKGQKVERTYRNCNKI